MTHNCQFLNSCWSITVFSPILCKMKEKKKVFHKIKFIPLKGLLIIRTIILGY